MVVWVSGCSCYETIGVMTLLNGRGIVARDFCAGSRPGAGDTLVLCFSSAPLLGWYRYLKTVLRVAGRYDVRLIVLCPEVVYRSGLRKKYGGSERREWALSVNSGINTDGTE